jgi:RNA polymerase sigma-70 factor (ECF subfamily)
METLQTVPVDEQLRTHLAGEAYNDALTLLTETYMAPVFRYCLRMCQGQRALAEEITQQVFEAACRSIGQFRAEASAKTWLFAIAHHQVLRALARQRRQEILLQQWSQTHPGQTEGSTPPEDDVPSSADVARLRAVLTQAALTPVDRSLVLLRFGINVPQALSVNEVATVLGLSRDMVYRRLKHSLAQLKKLLDQPES